MRPPCGVRSFGGDAGRSHRRRVRDPGVASALVHERRVVVAT